MRLLHTADWHVGSTLAGTERFDETGKLLDELYTAACSEQVDAVVVAGDIFDNPMPGNISQKLVFDFFARLSSAGIRSVILAGNHDGQVFVPSKSLLSLGTATVFEKPSNVDYRVAFRSRADEPVVITALPYPHERLVMRLNGVTDNVRSNYAESVGGFIRWLAGTMQPTDINVFAAHLMIGGAQLTETERPLSVSPFFEVSPQALPSQTLYNALGHVHRHQQITKAPARTEYAGSIFRVNFSEEGTPKGFDLVEADLKGNVSVHFCELQSALELHNVDCTPDDWKQRLEPFQGRGYTKARVHADDPPYNLQGEIRGACPWVIKVEFLHTEQKEAARPSIEALAGTDLSTIQKMYRAFDPQVSDDLVKTVGELYEEVTRAHTDAGT